MRRYVFVYSPCPRTSACHWFWEGEQGWGPWAGFQQQSEPVKGFLVKTQTVHAEVGLRVYTLSGEKGFFHGVTDLSEALLIFIPWKTAANPTLSEAHAELRLPGSGHISVASPCPS